MDPILEPIIKSFLGQMDSAMKISKIICEHSDDDDEENILTGDHIICGLIYRLMVPMTDEDMSESLDKADDIMNDSGSDSEYEYDCTACRLHPEGVGVAQRC